MYLCSPLEGIALLSQDAPSSSKCTFQIELNGSYLSTLATGLRQHPPGGGKGCAIASCTTSLSFLCNPFKERFLVSLTGLDPKADAKVGIPCGPTKLFRGKFQENAKVFAFLDINQPKEGEKEGKKGITTRFQGVYEGVERGDAQSGRSGRKGRNEDGMGGIIRLVTKKYKKKWQGMIDFPIKRVSLQKETLFPIP